MGEVINLNQARKRKQRAEKAGKAASNRAKHGRDKAQRGRESAEKEKLDKTLDQHALDDEE
ncbi:MAG: DUF4169 family protein [Inquilinus sp.]|nr:DUF4169 family protein [Inquilinus sp.]